MSFSLDQILPSLLAPGVIGYWLIGLCQVGVPDLARDALLRDLIAQRATQSPPIHLPWQAGVGQTAGQVQALVLTLP